MPSDTSINVKTSAAAAFCARLLVHPLDNVRVSIQSSAGATNGMIPWLEHLSTTVRREFQYQQKRHEQQHQLYKDSPKKLYQERISVYKGLYRGVSFALVFQVPALAFFLSTYDATKHAIATMAHSANMPSFQLHDFETHLLSGIAAKAAGTVIWAPMNRIQSLATHPVTGQVPLTLKEAFRLAGQVCRAEGVSGLWSGYTTSLSALLPYTMLYFATYEQLKQLARWMVSSKENGEDYWTSLREYWSEMGRQGRAVAKADLTLDVYMLCVASAVVVSSTVCQTAMAVRTAILGDLVSTHAPASSSGSFPAARKPLPLSSFVETIRKQSMPTSPISPLSPTKNFPSALSVVASTGSYSLKHPPVVSAQFKTLMSSSSVVASQALMSLPWQQSQHATLSTTSFLPFRNTMSHQHLKGLVHPVSSTSWQPSALSVATPFNQHHSISGPQPYKPSNLMSMMMAPSASSHNDNEINPSSSSNTINTRAKASQTQTSGLVRTIVRGLGPRILWTVPGVTLTTAGFEVLRNMALGSDN